MTPACRTLTTILVAVLAIAAGRGPAGAQAVAVPAGDTAGLLVHLPFDGDLRDAGPRAIAGRSNGDGLGFAPGVFGEALAFGGANGWVTVSGDSIRSPDGSFTLELWARRDRAGPRWASETLATFDGVMLVMSDGVDADRNSIDALFITGHGAVWLRGTAPLTGLRWTHVALAYDASRRLATLYVNGHVSGAPVRVDSIPVAARAPLAVGEGRPSSAFRGWIDDVRLYDHARSAESIARDAAVATAVVPVPAKASAATRPTSDAIAYTGVYDVRDETTNATPSSAVILTLVGLTMIVILVKLGRIPARMPSLVGLAAMVVTAAFVPQMGDREGETREMQRALKEGRYTLVEGRVENFSPGTRRRGSRVERFVVHANERVYSYSYYRGDRRPGFRTPSYLGGPIRSMLRVRIADVDGRIARLEIAPEPGIGQ